MIMKKFLSTIALLFATLTSVAQTWIWYPGDMDLWTGNRVNNLRTENGGMWPAFWRTDSHWQNIEFSKTYTIEQDEDIEIATEGQYSVKIDQWFVFGMPSRVTLPKGKHTVKIVVSNLQSPPCLWVNGKTVKTDDTWRVSNFAVPERPDTWYSINGKPMFDAKEKRPSLYRLPVSAVSPNFKEYKGNELFVDFGRECIGYLRLNKVKGNGIVKVWYGESLDEARDKKWAYLQDRVLFSKDSITDMQNMTFSYRSEDYRLVGSRAMRYVLIEWENGMSLDGVTLMSEMKDLGEKYRGSFVCNDTLLNKIWNVSAYTLHLTDREVMIEGIKRDRWMWSGDAIQSYLMNYYVFMDAPVVKRTIWAMRGKDPVQQHINTILDYTFYWFNSVYNYYLYTGDKDFVSRIYPRMQTLMAYVESRLDSCGMVQGQKGDWVFVDWSPCAMSKNGELSFEQIVYLRSIEAMSLCAEIVGNQYDKQKYTNMSEKLKSQLVPLFWNEDKKAFVHTVVNGKQSDEVTRYANMFAVLYDLVDAQRGQDILHHVLLNDSVMHITTPYMRFYELESLCALGEHKRVLKEMRRYWGGMLGEGATSFWETYDPNEKYPERLSMYDHPYGKSLCHAWGASPIYLLGKYYLGIRPIKPGYEEWEAMPHLGDLKWMKGDVPTPNGLIHLEMTTKEITVQADGCGYGTLFIKSTKYPKVSKGTVEALGDNTYRVKIEAGEIISVKGDF